VNKKMRFFQDETTNNYVSLLSEQFRDTLRSINENIVDNSFSQENLVAIAVHYPPTTVALDLYQSLRVTIKRRIGVELRYQSMKGGCIEFCSTLDNREQKEKLYTALKNGVLDEMLLRHRVVSIKFFDPLMKDFYPDNDEIYSFPEL